MKKLLRIFIILLVLVGVLVLTKSFIIKMAVEKTVESITGLSLTMEKLDVAFLKTYIDIKDFKLFNPSGFPDPVMLEAPELYIDYDLGSLLKQKLNLTVLRINLKEFLVVKNKEGKLNLGALLALRGDEKTEAKKEPVKMPEIQTD